MGNRTTKFENREIRIVIIKSLVFKIEDEKYIHKNIDKMVL